MWALPRSGLWRAAGTRKDTREDASLYQSNNSRVIISKTSQDGRNSPFQGRVGTRWGDGTWTGAEPDQNQCHEVHGDELLEMVHLVFELMATHLEMCSA